MSIRCRHTITVELEIEIDVIHREDRPAEVCSAQIAGVEFWPLVADRAEFAALREQIADYLADWDADRLMEEIEAEEAGL